MTEAQWLPADGECGIWRHLIWPLADDDATSALQRRLDLFWPKLYPNVTTWPDLAWSNWPNLAWAQVNRLFPLADKNGTLGSSMTAQASCNVGGGQRPSTTIGHHLRRPPKMSGFCERRSSFSVLFLYIRTGLWSSFAAMRLLFLRLYLTTVTKSFDIISVSDP